LNQLTYSIKYILSILIFHSGFTRENLKNRLKEIKESPSKTNSAIPDLLAPSEQTQSSQSDNPFDLKPPSFTFTGMENPEEKTDSSNNNNNPT